MMMYILCQEIGEMIISGRGVGLGTGWGLRDMNKE